MRRRLSRATGRRLVGRARRIAGGRALAVTGLVTFHEVVILQAALDPFLTALALFLLARALPGPAPARLSACRPRLRAAGAEPAQRAGRGARGRAAAVGAPGLRAEGLHARRRIRAPAAPSPRARDRSQLAVSGEPVLVSSHGGLNFYIGNRAEADGTYRSIPGITPDIAGQSRDARASPKRRQGRSLTARDGVRLFHGARSRMDARAPGTVGGSLPAQARLLLSDAEIPLNHSYAYYQRDERTLLRVLAVGPWLLVPLGLFGLLDRLRQRERDGFALWASFVPVYAFSVAAFFVASRYRLPLLVPLAIAAGFALVRVGGAVARREWPRVGACALALAPLVALTLWPHRLDDGRSEERTALFEYLVDNGRGAEALERLPALEADHPQKALLLHRLGRAFQDRGEAAQAALLLERALAAEPQRTETRLALGRALLDAERPAEAIPHLRALHDAGVRPDVSGFELARGLAANGQRDECVESGPVSCTCMNQRCASSPSLSPQLTVTPPCWVYLMALSTRFWVMRLILTGSPSTHSAAGPLNRTNKFRSCA